MTTFCCVRATLAVVVFCCLAVENHLKVVSGCLNSGPDNNSGSSGQSNDSCPCGGEPPSRYVNRTDVIKEDILRKLRMLQPPNATAQLRHLPAIPLLHSIIQQANNENNNRERNQNENDGDDDDDHVTAMTILALSQTVLPQERPGLSDVVKFKLNTSGVSGDDVISARLGVYIRQSSTSSSVPRRRWRGSSQQRRHRGLSQLIVRDVTSQHHVHPLIRRTIYNVGHHGRWLVFERTE